MKQVKHTVNTPKLKIHNCYNSLTMKITFIVKDKQRHIGKIWRYSIISNANLVYLMI